MLQNRHWHAAPVQADLSLALRQLRNAGGGLQQPFFGIGTQFADIDGAIVRRQRQRRTTHVGAVERGGRGVEGGAAAPDPPLIVLYQPEVGTIAVQRGELPWEVRIDINHQITAGAEFLQRQAI